MMHFFMAVVTLTAFSAAGRKKNMEVVLAVFPTLKLVKDTICNEENNYFYLKLPSNCTRVPSVGALNCECSDKLYLERA